MKKLCSKLEKTEVSYWIEDALIYEIMRIVSSILWEEYCKNRKMDVLQICESPFQKKNVDFIKSLLENEVISKPEHVDFYMDYKNIADLF